MFNNNAEEKAMERVNRRNYERVRRAYKHVFESPDGRAFVQGLCYYCHMYSPTKGLMDVGKRQIALGIRRQAIELGYFDEWQKAEAEAEEFKKENRRMLEQTEAKENEY